MYDWQSHVWFSLSFQVFYNEILCSGILCLVSHRCFQIIPFGSVVRCSILVGLSLNKSRKPGGSFSFFHRFSSCEDFR